MQTDSADRLRALAEAFAADPRVRFAYLLWMQFRYLHAVRDRARAGGLSGG